MKRYTFTVLLVILGVLTVCGQKIDDKKDPLYPRAGFKGGVSYNTILGDSDASARIRIHVGAVVEYPISSRFFIQGELLYSAQGFTLNLEDEEQDVSLNYLSLPIIAKIHFTESFSLETGPQLSTLANVGNDDVPDDDVFFDSFNDFDFSWAFGAGYKLESGLFFQLRYNLGITNINDTEVIDISNTNSVAQVSIGYLFKTKNNRRIIQENYQ